MSVESRAVSNPPANLEKIPPDALLNMNKHLAGRNGYIRPLDAHARRVRVARIEGRGRGDQSMNAIEIPRTRVCGTPNTGPPG